MIRRLAAIILCVVFTLTPAFAGMPKQVLTSTHRTQMTVDNPDGTRDGAICSATAIGPHSLLTAAHCDLGASIVLVDGALVAIVERIGDGNDHVIYITNATFDKFTPLVPTEDLKVGDEVWLRGNPAGLNQLVRRGVFSGVIVNDGEVIHMFDINGWHGDSGAAIFNSKGKIVAVVTYGFSAGGFDMIGTLQIRFTYAQLGAVQ